MSWLLIYLFLLYLSHTLIDQIASGTCLCKSAIWCWVFLQHHHLDCALLCIWKHCGWWRICFWILLWVEGATGWPSTLSVLHTHKHCSETSSCSCCSRSLSPLAWGHCSDGTILCPVLPWFLKPCFMIFLKPFYFFLLKWLIYLASRAGAWTFCLCLFCTHFPGKLGGIIVWWVRACVLEPDLVDS